MKQKIYILGVVTSLIIFIGVILKVNHFPGAGIMLTLGIGSLVLIFLPLALISNYKNEEIRPNKSLHIVTYLTCFVVFTSMLFKIQHWPLTNILLMIALPFPYMVFLPVFLAVTTKRKNFNIYNTIFVLFLLALNSVFSGLLALNVSKERIEESYNLSRNYTKIESLLKQFPENHILSPVNLKMDEALRIVNDYRDKILKHEGISTEQWNSKPGNLLRGDAYMVAANAIMNPNGPPPGIELQIGLKNLITEFAANPDYKSLAGAAPSIFTYSEGGEEYDSWARQTFVLSPLSWSLIYLDGLEANLYMIKASGPAIN
jgi:hypothetical protein